MSAPEFTNSFIDRIKTILDSACTAGSPSITQDQLCKKLELDVYWKPTIGSIIKAGLLSGYELRCGNGGGICRAGMNRPKKTGLMSMNIPDTFLKDLKTTLLFYCGKDYVSREAILSKMPKQYPNAKMLMSAAMKQGFLPEFESKGGHGGGLRKIHNV